jgi:hypothetical protein
MYNEKLTIIPAAIILIAENRTPGNSGLKQS